MVAKGFSWDEVEGQMGLKVKTGMGGQVKHDIRGSSETGKYLP